MNIVSFVFQEHFGLALRAALLFLVGALFAFPAVKFGSARWTWLPLALLRTVLRMLGKHPGMTRLASVIFGCNGTLMFLYMASGVHPAFPAAISVWTGYNLAVILFVAGETNDPALSADDPRKPAKWIAGLCGAAVVILELPCFWYSIAMGIGLGQEVTADRTDYLQGIAVRIHAYACIILPLLLLSASCEAVAIRGLSAPPPQAPPPAVGGHGSGPRF
jgi:hypothetical protein